MSKKSGQRLRMSIAGKFLKAKDTDSHNSFGKGAPFNLTGQIQQPAF
jgi:hypothetical protein